ncbi:hypothetical protein [Parafrankia elaeagni]|nr:hypothetical protein [Parafrankia elaeagni]
MLQAELRIKDRLRLARIVPPLGLATVDAGWSGYRWQFIWVDEAA